MMLPLLRDELSLHPAPNTAHGAPEWTIRDPVRNRYFRIPWPTFEILLRWDLDHPERIATAVNQETTLQVTADDVLWLVGFLQRNQLTQSASSEDVRRLAQQARRGRPPWWRWLLHHYLYFRVPLVRPDRFLSATLPMVTWLGSRWFMTASLGALLVGMVLVLRQWELFAATFGATLNAQGALSYAVALTMVKTIHELAHAYCAKRFGCRTPTMGIAFLVLWPILYTDVNEVWKLVSRRQRLLVSGAGILSELTVAAWATLAWAFLPDGPTRQTAFILAAITWISSLLINLSPFMRFDGYFLLMDAIETPNLHDRSFALARWWMRERLFGLGDPVPEVVPTARRNLLIAFALLVWSYRLVVFLGIAVLVYHFFIKAVGVFLFVVELGWFVFLPIWREMMVWRDRLETIRARRRSWWTLGVLGLFLLLAIVPWTSQITAPALSKGGEDAGIYLPFPARIAEIHVTQGQTVVRGQPLFTFVAPDLDHELSQIAARVEKSRHELEGATLNVEYRERLGVIREELSKGEKERSAIRAEQARLTLSAPIDGVVLDLLPSLQSGQWLSSKQRLTLVRSQGKAVVDAYVAEDDLERIALWQPGTFFPHDLGQAPVRGIVQVMDRSPAKVITDKAIASVYHGELASYVSGQQIVPVGAVYRVRLVLEAEAPFIQRPGVVVIDGERQSLVNRLLRSVLIVLVREWGA